MPSNENDQSGNLFDLMIGRLALKNDAALARSLKVAAPVISKIRTGRLKFGPSMILKAHKLTGWPIEEIESLLKKRAGG